jgi:hypothetical protein
MAIKDEESRMLETQKPYEAPRAVRLSDSRGGAGSGTETCRGPGSGAGGDCVSQAAARASCLPGSHGRTASIRHILCIAALLLGRPISWISPRGQRRSRSMAGL